MTNRWVPEGTPTFAATEWYGAPRWLGPPELTRNCQEHLLKIKEEVVRRCEMQSTEVG